ncbi:MAG: hypothetical protein ACI4HO_09930 [Ruminococcus sp.]
MQRFFKGNLYEISIPKGEINNEIKICWKEFWSGFLNQRKVYEATIEDEDYYRIIDDSGEDYLYPKINPAPLDGSCEGVEWEIIEK